MTKQRLCNEFSIAALGTKKNKKKKQKTKAKNKSSIQGVWFVNVEEKADKEERIKLKRTSRVSKTRAVTWGTQSEQFGESIGTFWLSL